jgi:Tfp pilus assembly protein FimT
LLLFQADKTTQSAGTGLAPQSGDLCIIGSALVKEIAMRIYQNNGTPEDGFTLFELAMILAIIAILASIAIPAFSVWMPNYKLRSAARDLYSSFQGARLGAVKQNKRWAVVFDQASNPGRYFVCSDDGANDVWDGPPAMGGDDTVEKTVNLSRYENIDFGHGTLNTDIVGNPFSGGDNIYYANDFVVFRPRGLSEKGYVYIQNNKNTVYGIGTRASGVIHLKKWKGSAWE